MEENLEEVEDKEEYEEEDEKMRRKQLGSGRVTRGSE